jgi:hypothetical protein
LAKSTACEGEFWAIFLYKKIQPNLWSNIFQKNAPKDRKMHPKTEKCAQAAKFGPIWSHCHSANQMSSSEASLSADQPNCRSQTTSIDCFCDKKYFVFLRNGPAFTVYDVQFGNSSLKNRPQGRLRGSQCYKTCPGRVLPTPEDKAEAVNFEVKLILQSQLFFLPKRFYSIDSGES